jgi:hypothetical protein
LDIRRVVEPLDQVLAWFAIFDAVTQLIASAFVQSPDFTNVCDRHDFVESLQR